MCVIYSAFLFLKQYLYKLKPYTMSRLDNVDLTKKENQTLKNWAILCWENWYFQILAFFIIFQQVILHNVDLNEPKVKLYINIGFGFVYFLLLFKGFYQHWNDLCKGTSR